MRTYLSALALTLLIISCSQSGTNLQDIATPVPTAQSAQVANLPLAQLQRGHGVYLRHCAQCHEHQLPNTATLPEYHKKVHSMSELAGITKAEEADLQSYLGQFTDR